MADEAEQWMAGTIVTVAIFGLTGVIVGALWDGQPTANQVVIGVISAVVLLTFVRTAGWMATEGRKEFSQKLRQWRRP